MERAVFDASVLLKIAVNEGDREAARALLEQCEEPVAPAWGLLECAHALWRKVRRGEHPAHDAEDAYERIADSGIEPLDPVGLIPTALALALRLDHSAYDCLYIATAMQEECPLVTADAKLAALAERCGVEVQLLGA